MAPVLTAVVAAAILLVQTRSLDGPPLDPASPVVPAVSLYPVPMSARPEQADLEEAVRAADRAAASRYRSVGAWLGALVASATLGAAVDRRGHSFTITGSGTGTPTTPGRRAMPFGPGTTTPIRSAPWSATYLARHGIGAVVVTGPTSETAATSPLLRPVRKGVYDVYSVIDPVTTVTFGDQNAESLEIGNRRIEAVSAKPGTPVTVRVNWYPRWEATSDAGRAGSNV